MIRNNLPGAVLDPAHPLSSGLVGWWPMNENAGNGLYDLVSGKVSVGTNVAAGWRTGSPLGGGVLFDGIDDYASFSIAKTYSGWSMSFWIRPDAWGLSSPYERTLMGCYDGVTYARMMFGGGTLAANKQRISIDSGYATLTTTVDQSLYVWIHVVGTCDAVSQRVYVNGSLIGSGNGALPISTSGTYQIGALPGYGRYFSGAMCNVRIYNRALSYDEVRMLYTQPLAGLMTQPSRPARHFIFSAAAPAVPPHPITSDRLHNRGGNWGRIWRRGETT